MYTRTRTEEYDRRRFGNNKKRLYPNLGGMPNAEHAGSHWRLNKWHLLGGAVGFVFFIIVVSQLWARLWK